MPLLCVNIDHAATVRQARYRDVKGGADVGEPDPILVAHEAQMGGAEGITVHLREDRRHIVDRDVEMLRRLVRVRLNLEMAATDEMVGIAGRTRPHTAMLVPEGRQEVTTEGGLDVAGGGARLRDIVKRLHDAGIMVSVFIDADARQIDAAAKAGTDVCEIHTGPYAHAFAHAGGDFRRRELLEQLRSVRDAATMIAGLRMRCNAGHALNYANVGPIAQIVHLANGAEKKTDARASAAEIVTASADRGELHIGHAIVSRAIFVGIRSAVSEMRAEIRHAIERLGASGSCSGTGTEELGTFGPLEDAGPTDGPGFPRRGNPTRLA